MIVFRLSKSKYSNDLSGRGAELTGGRWNSRGTRMIYTSQLRALCTTEIAVHTPLGILPVDYLMVMLEIPDQDHFTAIELSELPAGWDSFPHSHHTQVMGDRFVKEGKFLVMKVPSAVIKGDYNFLINPDHPGISRVKILSSEPFEFDRRLFR